MCYPKTGVFEPCLSVHLFVRVIQCRFIFLGKNDGLTPDFPPRSPPGHRVPMAPPVPAGGAAPVVAVAPGSRPAPDATSPPRLDQAGHALQLRDPLLVTDLIDDFFSFFDTCI